MRISRRDLQDMFVHADADGVGEITREQFLAVMAQTNLFK